MSRSNNTEVTNPAKRFYEWNGDKGGFRYFDRTKADEGKGIKGVNIVVPLPFRFIVLDTLSTIKGYSDDDKSGFWSNEIRDIKTETLVVRTKKGVCAKGVYDVVIKDRNCTGAKYCQSVYIAYKNGSVMEICNVQMVGAALSAWIDFRKKNKVFECAVEVATMLQAQKGKTIYQMPVFKAIKVSPESDAEAKKLDVELQSFLIAYFKIKQQQVAQEVIQEKAEEETKNEGLAQATKEESLVPDIFPSDSDLPF